MLPMALPRASFFMLPMALPRFPEVSGDFRGSHFLFEFAGPRVWRRGGFRRLFAAFASFRMSSVVRWEEGETKAGHEGGGGTAGAECAGVDGIRSEPTSGQHRVDEEEQQQDVGRGLKEKMLGEAGVGMRHGNEKQHKCIAVRPRRRLK